MSKKPPSFNSWDRVWANFLKTKFKTDIFTSFLKSNYETLSSILILQRLPISKLVVMFRCTVASFRYSNTLDGSCHLLFSIFFCRTTNLLHNCSIFIIHLAMLRLTLATYEGAASLDTRLSLSYLSVFPEVTWNFPTKLNLSARPSTPKTTLSPIEPLYSP